MKNFFKKIWSNRPFRTFLQGFIGVFAGVQIFDLKDINVVKTLVISGLMAGLSAVMSLNTGEENEVLVVTDKDMESDKEYPEEIVKEVK